MKKKRTAVNRTKPKPKTRIKNRPRIKNKPRKMKIVRIIKNALKYIEKYKEIILYLVFGGLTTLLNMALSFILYSMMGLSAGLSTGIAWVISLIYAYIVNRVFVFESKAKELNEIARESGSFFAARSITGASDIFIMWYFVDVLFLNWWVFKIISQIFTIVFNYVASKLFIFKEQKD